MEVPQNRELPQPSRKIREEITRPYPDNPAYPVPPVYLLSILNSTRRFLALPSGVLLGAIGWEKA